ncbi:MAG: hypothetical protein HKN07_05255 [Acidimicrobiia bacterium]|nr:hypothetical protein [Acidimicrobiia bacterium]
MVVSSAESTEETELADIGVLFVHGIGQQKRGDTLIAAGDAVHEFLARWFTTGNVAKGTSRAVLMPDPADPAAPAHVYASMEQTFADDTTTESNWLMAESWWAESFPPPKFFDLAVWAFQVMPWTLATHYGRGVRRAWLGTAAASGLLRTSWWFVAFVGRLIQLLIVFAVIPILVLLVAIIALIGAIPIGGVRAFAGGAQRILSASLGDSFIFVRKPIQASAIHEKVRRDLEWLGERSRKVAVVAHSQGAAVAHEVIKDDPRHDIVAFISLGSGLGKLLELRNERETVQITQRTPKETSAAPFAGSIGMALIAWALYYGLAGTNGWAASAFAGVFGLILVGVATQSAWVGRVPKIEEVALPGWVEWIDLFAAKDPVPHGRLFDTDEVDPACGILSWVESRFDPEYGPREKSLPRSGVAHNYGSFTSDHNAYWLNRDGVVPMVALAIAKYSPGLRLDEIDPLDQSRVVAGALRRRFRVRWLQVARWMTVAAGAFALLGLGWKDQLLGLSRPTLVGARAVSSWVPGWALDWSENTVVGVLTLVVPVLLIYVGLSYLWRWWGYVESHELYRRGFPDPFPAQMIIFMLVLALLVEVGVLIGLGHRLGIVPGLLSVAAFSVTLVIVTLMAASSVTPMIMRLWRGVFGDGKGVLTGPPAELLGYRRLMLLVGIPALVVFPVIVVDPEPPTSVARVFGAYGLGLVLFGLGSLVLHTQLVRRIEAPWSRVSRSGPPELILSRLAGGKPVADAQLRAAAEVLIPWLDFYAESLRQVEADPPAIAESNDWAKMARTARLEAQRATEVARLLEASDVVLAGRLALAAVPLHPVAVELAVEMRMLDPDAALTAMQRLARNGPRRDRSRARRWLNEQQDSVTAG